MQSLSLRLLKALSNVRSAAVFVLVSTLALLAGCGSHGLPTAASAVDSQVHLQGTVAGGQQPVSNSTIQLYAVGEGGDGTAATPLITTTVLTNTLGAFNITHLFDCPSDNPDVYLVATGGNPGLADGTNNTALVMMAALGPCLSLTPQTFITVNEVTTVASVLSLAPFMNASGQVASGTADAAALAAAFTQVTELENPATGTSPGLVAPPAGYMVPTAEINSLADALAACVNSSGPAVSGAPGPDASPCGMLFQYTTATGAAVSPASISTALLSIARNPTLNLTNIFGLQSSTAPFQPVLTAAPAAWNVALMPMITLTTATSPLAVGATGTGTITLPAAAPVNGLTVTLTTSDATAVSLSSSTATIAAGQTTATFTYMGVASKAATITATATGYAYGTLAVTPTNNILTLGSFGTVRPNQVITLPVGTTQNTAAATVVTLTITSATQEGILNLTTYNDTVTIPSGSNAPVTQPQFTAGNAGMITITATAPGYVTATTTMTVSVTASIVGNTAVPIGVVNQVLSITGTAPPSGINFTLTSSAPAVATVPASVTIPSGANSVNIPITGIASGHTLITATATGIAPVSTTATVTGVITSQDQITGVHMMVYSSFSIGQTFTNPTVFTVTSNNPNIVTVAKDGATKGTASVSFTLTNSGGAYFTMQGQALGSTTVTISAPGYSNAIANVSVDPAGFGFSTGSGTTTTLSGPQNVQFYVSALDPVSLQIISNATLNPDAQPVNFAVVSSNPAVGTVSSPQFTTPTYAYGTFTPVGTGTTTLSLTQPAGFTAPAFQPTITMTVVLPPLSIAGITTGVHGQLMDSFSLGITPATPVTATVTIGDPTIALVSSDPTVKGSTSVSYANVSYSQTNLASGSRSFWVQGQRLGTTTLTISAPGFATATAVVTVNTAGFSYLIGQPTATEFGGQVTGTLTLNVQDQYSYSYGLSLNPDYGAVNVGLVSSDTAVGTITNAGFGVAAASAPITFTAGNKLGTTTLSITQPAGFMNTVNSPTAVATVVPAAVAGSGSYVSGVHLETMQTFNLPGVAGAPVVVTLTATGGNVLLSSDPLVVGSPTLQITVPDSRTISFYTQGEVFGSGQITFSAAGYVSVTNPYIVHNSSLVLSGGVDFPGPEPSYQPIPLVVTAEILLDAVPLNAYIGITAYLAPDVGTLNLVTGGRPVTMSAGQATVTTYYDAAPESTGEVDLSVTEPPGFMSPPAFSGVAMLIFSPPNNGVPR